MTWKVKKAFAQQQLRLEDVARALGCSNSCVSQVLSGQHKGYALRPKIAALLGVSEAALAREIAKAKLVNKSTPVATRDRAA